MLDGFSGAGLFRTLSWHGAATEFVDSRSVEEIRASGEIERTIRAYRSAKDEGKSGKGKLLRTEPVAGGR